MYARTNNGSAAVDTALAGAWFGTPHRFRIDWTPTSVTYSIDGTAVVTHTIPRSPRACGRLRATTAATAAR